MPKPADKRRVFISYAHADRDFAGRVAETLKRDGLTSWFAEWDLAPGDSIAARIQEALSASDYLVVLLSPDAVSSQWVQLELAASTERELRQRNVTVIPVLLRSCEIPISLASHQILDLRSDREHGLKKLIDLIGHAPEIDFSRLDWQTFEKLVADLLESLGFQNIRHEVMHQGMQFDLEATFGKQDPFRRIEQERWLVEVKFYKRERPDLAALRQLAAQSLMVQENIHLALITNGQLTSAAAEWLRSQEAGRNVRLRVIDGRELQRLLLQAPTLVHRYFSLKSAK